jgi:DNA-binding transcriptional LysR family regulator
MVFKRIGNIMDNLGDIRLFVEAANQGGLSAAGRKLGLSPAAASARLLKLESGLHTRLFERTTRHLRLTDEGRHYLAYCRQALQALEDGQAFLQAGKSLVRGKVRISATSDFGRHVLPRTRPARFSDQALRARKPVAT